jgi:hypothetical protein
MSDRKPKRKVEESNQPEKKPKQQIDWSQLPILQDEDVTDVYVEWTYRPQQEEGWQGGQVSRYIKFHSKLDVKDLEDRIEKAGVEGHEVVFDKISGGLNWLNDVAPDLGTMTSYPDSWEPNDDEIFESWGDALDRDFQSLDQIQAIYVEFLKRPGCVIYGCWKSADEEEGDDEDDDDEEKEE